MNPPARHVDLNCDLGEAATPAQWAVECQIIPFITSANIACGLHAGSPELMRQTIIVAKQHRVAIGAHPGLPDRKTLGRQEWSMPALAVEASFAYQIGALAGVARLEGVTLSHVKPHGALYNMAAWNLDLALAIAQAVAAVDRGLILVGLAGSRLIEAGMKLGLRVAAEAFVDRAYHQDGRLVSREHPDALLSDNQAVESRLRDLLENGRIASIEGPAISIRADTFCLHADTPNALSIARVVRTALTAANISARRLNDAGM
jgi:UPF0271 protein